MADPGAGPFVATVQAARAAARCSSRARTSPICCWHAAANARRSSRCGSRWARAAGGSRGRLFIEGSLLAAIAVVLARAARVGRRLAVARVDSGVRDPIRPGLALPAGSARVVFCRHWPPSAATATLLFALVPAIHAARAGVSDSAATRQARTTTASRAAPLAAQRARDGAGGPHARAAVRLGADAWRRPIGRPTVLRLRQAQPADRAADAARSGPYAEPERRRQFIDSVLERMRAIPAVSSVGDDQQPAVRGRQHVARLLARRAR